MDKFIQSSPLRFEPTLDTNCDLNTLASLLLKTFQFLEWKGLKISLKFVKKGPANNKSYLVHLVTNMDLL